MSASTITRLRSLRSATRPPCRPKTRAGMLSARRTASTPSGPALTNANHIKATYWNASPSSLITTAEYVRRKSRRRSSRSARSYGSLAATSASSGAAVIGSATLPETRLARAMAQATAIRLTGDDLRIEDVWAVATDEAAAALSDEARTKMRAARALVERAAHGTREHTYGINTGFGRFVSKSIPEELTEELQLRLLRSHAAGVGDPYPAEIVRAAMVLRANALAKGNSGARIETVELLLELLARGVLPRVPSRGSVGASGDLAPLAHLALPLVGEGEAWYDGELLPGGEALAAAGLEPTRLAAKEGLSLINGTQFMAAFGALGVMRARRLAQTADLACALSLEALQGSRTSFLPQIHRLRPLRGQADSAANILRLLEGSAINEAHRWVDKVPD